MDIQLNKQKIPTCVRHPYKGGSLLNSLQQLNKQISKRQGKPQDTSFSKSDFRYAKRLRLSDKLILNHDNFNQFTKTIDRYVKWSGVCTTKCNPDIGKVDTEQPMCLPLSSILPSSPRPLRRRQPVAKRQSTPKPSQAAAVAPTQVAGAIAKTSLSAKQRRDWSQRLFNEAARHAKTVFMMAKVAAMERNPKRFDAAFSMALRNRWNIEQWWDYDIGPYWNYRGFKDKPRLKYRNGIKIVYDFASAIGFKRYLGVWGKSLAKYSGTATKWAWRHLSSTGKLDLKRALLFLKTTKWSNSEKVDWLSQQAVVKKDPKWIIAARPFAGRVSLVLGGRWDAYNVMVKAMISLNRFGGKHGAVALANSIRGSEKSDAYDAMIKAQTGLKRFDGKYGAIALLKARPSGATYGVPTYLLAALVRNGRDKAAQNLTNAINPIKNPGYPTEQYKYIKYKTRDDAQLHVIEAMVQAGRFNQALAYYKSLPLYRYAYASERAAAILMKIGILKKDSSIQQMALKLIRSKRYPQKRAVDAYIRYARYKKNPTLLMKYTKKGHIGYWGYHNILMALLQDGHISEAEKFLELEVVRSAFTNDWPRHALKVFKAWIERGKLQQAAALAKKIRVDSSSRNGIVAAVRVAVARKDLKALNLLAAITRRSGYFNEIVAEGMIAVGFYKQAYKQLKLLKAYDYAQRRIAHIVLAFAKKSRFTEAAQGRKMLTMKTTYKMRPYLKLLVKAGRIREAETFIAGIRNKKVKLTLYTWLGRMTRNKAYFAKALAQKPIGRERIWLALHLAKSDYFKWAEKVLKAGKRLNSHDMVKGLAGIGMIMRGQPLKEPYKSLQDPAAIVDESHRSYWYRMHGHGPWNETHYPTK